MLSLALSCGGGGGSVYTVTTPASGGSPLSISAVAGNGSVIVSWSAVTGATAYNVYSSLSASVSKATGTKHTVVGTTFIDTGLTNGIRYYYVMTSVISGLESPDSSMVSANPGTTGTISGKIAYEDKELGAGGFTGNTSMKAVRFAAVDVVDAANPASPLHTTWTDSLGMYSIQTGTGSTTVYVRVNSLATAPTATAPVTVMNLSGVLYGVPSTNVSLAGSANVNIMIPSTYSVAGAFNILDVMTSGFAFINDLSGSYPIVPLNVFWEPGNLLGTYYCNAGQCSPGDGIYVLSQTGGDTDEYDDDVLWHEFGHFAASIYSLDDSPGGNHFLGDNQQDLRLSWSEGWGDFFPGALKIWLIASGQNGLLSNAGVTPTTYIDTSATGGFLFDFGNPYPFINSSNSSNEVAVAKLLSDLDVAASSTMQNIWNVITNFKTIPPGANPVNLELFWDRWLSVIGIGTPSTLNTIFGNRLINYALDGYETDNDFLTAKTYTAGFPQIHTLYTTGDEDFIIFTATNITHTITTGNLINGADTFLSLYGPAGTFITSNDNALPLAPNPPNNATALSSQIIFSPFVLGQTYYVSVKTSTARPASAGKYGSYTLAISP